MENEELNAKSSLPRVVLIIAIALLVILGLFLNFSSRQSSANYKNKLCSSCHQMSPQVLTWQRTAHSKISCSKCHPDSSLFGMVFRSKTGAFKTPITAKNFDDKVCIECHTTDRNVTPPFGLKASHSLHLSKGVDCVDCHRDVAHAQVTGKILEPGLRNVDSFSEGDAQKLVAYGNRIPMDTCMRCHNGAKAPKECLACHSNKPVPANHKVPAWKSAHGTNALKDLKSCNFCHEYDVGKQKEAKTISGDYQSVQNYARTNSFCKDCHLKRPVTHNQFYSVAHRTKAIGNRQSCLVCHDDGQGANLTAPPTTQVYCSKCHVVSRKHTPDWVNTHKKQAQLQNAESCFSCHDVNSCNKCHSARNVNRSAFPR